MHAARPAQNRRVIDVSHLTKRYGGQTAVNDLTFTVRSGAVTGFLGPNGAGKSTTMRMMLGLTRPDAGATRIDGHTYQQLRYPTRHVGAVLESSAPHRSLTAIHHLRWLTQCSRLPGRRVGEVLEVVGLTGAGRQRVGTFSLGMNQRLALAAALLGDPPILVLDEPANGLDAEGIRWLRELLRAMAAEGRTVLLSSHLMAEMSVLADHLIVIDRGRILADMSMAAFIQRHGQAYVRVRTPDVGRLHDELDRNGAAAWLAPDGSLQVGGMSAAEINRLAARSGLVLDELSTQTGSLEEIFLGLVGGQGGSNG